MGLDGDIVDRIATKVFEKIEQRMDTYLNQRAAPVPSALASPASVDAMAPGTRVVGVVRRREEEDDANGQSSVKKYKLSRDLNTVPQLWEEWTSGLSNNLPSVIELEEKFGTKWRSESTGNW
jgi:hypothetical protein